MIKITTSDEFEMLRKKKGYITISDKPTKTVKVHVIDCPHVSKEYFNKKVVEGRELNGSYFWTENAHEAISLLQAELCLVCGR